MLQDRSTKVCLCDFCLMIMFPFLFYFSFPLLPCLIFFSFYKNWAHVHSEKSMHLIGLKFLFADGTAKSKYPKYKEIFCLCYIRNKLLSSEFKVAIHDTE